jgi:leucyl aminopeptidase
MPLFREYRELIRSEIGDIKNAGGRLAGAITGAWFVREFSGDTPWVHLDIAGSATNEKPRPYAPAGPNGIGVGTFINLAQRLAREGKLA